MALSAFIERRITLLLRSPCLRRKVKVRTVRPLMARRACQEQSIQPAGLRVAEAAFAAPRASVPGAFCRRNFTKCAAHSWNDISAISVCRRLSSVRRSRRAKAGPRLLIRRSDSFRFSSNIDIAFSRHDLTEQRRTVGAQRSRAAIHTVRVSPAGVPVCDRINDCAGGDKKIL